MWQCYTTHLMAYAGFFPLGSLLRTTDLSSDLCHSARRLPGLLVDTLTLRCLKFPFIQMSTAHKTERVPIAAFNMV